MMAKRTGYLLFVLSLVLGIDGILLYHAFHRPKTRLPIPTVSHLSVPIDTENHPEHEMATDAPINTQGDTAPTFKSGDKPPQFIVLSFDGSKSLEMWKQTTEFAKDLTAQGKPLKFTYFISGVYFLTPQTKNLYRPPHHATGTSAIGYAESAKDIENRAQAINQTLANGNEIGSHANGHFNGASWSSADWTSEMTQFASLTQAAGQLNLPQGHYAGFRAPELGRSDQMDQVLKSLGYRYDASRVGKPTEWPTQNKSGLWSVPLAKINFATSSSMILSMDYNFYFKQSHAKDLAKKGTPLWQRYHDEMLTSYEKYFETNYNGTRAPVIIGHHFSLWNDGVYWEVMKEFAEKHCGQPDVRCVTFSELIDWMDAQKK